MCPSSNLYKNSGSYLLTTHFYCFHYSRDKYFLNAVRKKSLVPSVQFSLSVVSDSLWPHEPQNARSPCPSPTPGVHPNPCPLCRWCHPTISSSVAPFSSCPQSFPVSGSFPVSHSSRNIPYCHNVLIMVRIADKLVKPYRRPYILMNQHLNKKGIYFLETLCDFGTSNIIFRKLVSWY